MTVSADGLAPMLLGHQSSTHRQNAIPWSASWGMHSQGDPSEVKARACYTGKSTHTVVITESLHRIFFSNLSGYHVI